METTKVGIREFRAGLGEYIASSQPVAVTRHGQTVGYFIPVPSHSDADLAALKQASATLDKLLAANSVSADLIAAEFDATRKPLSGQRKKPIAKRA